MCEPVQNLAGPSAAVPASPRIPAPALDLLHSLLEVRRCNMAARTNRCRWIRSGGPVWRPCCCMPGCRACDWPTHDPAPPQCVDPCVVCCACDARQRARALLPLRADSRPSLCEADSVAFRILLSSCDVRPAPEPVPSSTATRAKPSSVCTLL